MISILKDIIEVIETGKREKGGSISEGIPSIGAEHLQSDGHINWSESSMRYISPSFFDTMKSGKLKIDDVLLVKDGATTGKVAYVDDIPSKNAAINEHVFLIRPRKRLLSKYLYYYLRSPIGMRKVLHYFHGAAIGGISRDFLNVEIKVPSLLKQEDVIRQLSNSEDVLQICNQLLAKFDTLVKSRFIEMFGDPRTNEKGWNTLPLCQTLELGSSVSYGIVQTGDNVSCGIPVFRPVDIVDGRIPKREDLKKTTKDISDKYKRTLLRGYELLITVRGTVGDTFQVTREFSGCNVGRNIVPLRFDTRLVLYPFMRHLFAQSGIKAILAHLTKGIALQGLNMGEFKEMTIILPPFDLQNQFAAFVEQVDKSKAVLHKLLEKQELLRAALMQEYFG